ncbi:MAG TPA: lysophospholipid acyltransferase family protein [Dyadobacter sp.]|jgi:KDO2-lipid IV(A) lauroyltransferase|nr:lysophospholipid acyltransferase family protein [Dyadobacter sp.]
MAASKKSKTIYENILLFTASSLSSLIYFLLHRVFRYRHDVVSSNLLASFPDKNTDEIKKMTKGYYRHMGDLIIEPILFVLIGSKGRSKLASYSNIEFVEKFYEHRKNVVALASHYGNWEYLINIPKMTRFSPITAYSPLTHKVANKWLLKIRSLYGVNLIAKNSFYKGVLTTMRSAVNPIITIVIADQRPAPGSNKYFVDFLGQSTCVQLGAERLANASGSEVVFLECRKKARFHYEYTFHSLGNETVAAQPLSITQAYYNMLEKNILASPNHWLWSHKRWKPVAGNA